MIGTYSYRLATEMLSEIQDLGDEALQPLLCVRSALLNADINTRERYRRELYAMLDNTYSYIATKHTIPSNPMISVVKSLNDHVLQYYGEEYGYETLDEFLADQYLQVPQTFADLSRWIGYTVGEVGDKSASWEDIDDNWEDTDLDWDKIGWENV